MTSVVGYLLDHDSSAFPDKPVFDLGGQCRMSFPGAEKITMAMIVENAPDAFDKMCLDYSQSVWDGHDRCSRVH